MDLIGKKFAIRAKNGKMVEYKIVDFQQFSQTEGFYFAEKTKGGKKEFRQFTPQHLLNGLNDGTIEVRI